MHVEIPKLLDVKTFISVSIDVIVLFGLNYENNILILFRFKYSKSLTVNMNKQEKRTSEYYLTSKKKLISQ